MKLRNFDHLMEPKTEQEQRNKGRITTSKEFWIIISMNCKEQRRINQSENKTLMTKPSTSFVAEYLGDSEHEGVFDDLGLYSFTFI